MSRYLRKKMDLAALGAILAPPVCDFCGLHAPEWMYAATQTAAGAQVECWRWCACPDCAARVEAEDFVPLIMQITNMLTPRLKGLIPPTMIRMAATQALHQFSLYAIRAEGPTRV